MTPDEISNSLFVSGHSFTKKRVYDAVMRDNDNGLVLSQVTTLGFPMHT